MPGMNLPETARQSLCPDERLTARSPPREKHQIARTQIGYICRSRNPLEHLVLHCRLAIKPQFALQYLGFTHFPYPPYRPSNLSNGPTPPLGPLAAS